MAPNADTQTDTHKTQTRRQKMCRQQAMDQ